MADEERSDAQARLIDDAVYEGVMTGIKDVREKYGDEDGDVVTVFCGMSGAILRFIDEFRVDGVSIQFAINQFCDGMHGMAKQMYPEDYQ